MYLNQYKISYSLIFSCIIVKKVRNNSLGAISQVEYYDNKK